MYTVYIVVAIVVNTRIQFDKTVVTARAFANPSRQTAAFVSGANENRPAGPRRRETARRLALRARPRGGESRVSRPSVLSRDFGVFSRGHPSVVWWSHETPSDLNRFQRQVEGGKKNRHRRQLCRVIRVDESKRPRADVIASRKREIRLAAVSRIFYFFFFF